MSQRSWCFWNLSISILVFLTLYNIFLTARLMYTPTCHTPEVPVVESHQPTIKCDSNTPPPPPLPPRERYFRNLDVRLGRWDARLLYKLYDNVMVGEDYVTLGERYVTCLATQSSLEKLHSIVEVTSHWSGAVSLATFAASTEELNLLLLYVAYLRSCFLNVRRNVAFHLAMPRERLPDDIRVDWSRLDEMSCEDPVAVAKELVKESLRGAYRWRSKLSYPQNHLRNLARKNCQTRYVFLTDVDVVPSRGMADSLEGFLREKKCDGRCAYVVPTFELDERASFPPNKSDLVRLANKGLARPFHHKVFIYNQYATNFTRWQNFHDPDDNKVRVSHPVTNFEFLYEPFYIAEDTVPPHDERFVGYGYTRNSQVYEMYVAGYEFEVLSPVFTCHWGLQVKRTRPPWREHQNNMNRKQFDVFKREVFARYDRDPLNLVKRPPPR